MHFKTWPRFGLTTMLAFISALAGGMFLVRECLLEFKGPSAEVAFVRFVEDPIPASVRNLRSEYSRHIKGFTLVIYFEASPHDVERMFPSQSRSSAEALAIAGWSKTRFFSRLEGIEPIDFEGAFNQVKMTKDGYRDVVISSDSRHVYVFVARDSDLITADS